MDQHIYDEFEVISITRDSDEITLTPTTIKVIDEISLKIILNDMEIAVIDALNQYQEELALGFLYHNKFIDSINDIDGIEYNKDQMTVSILKRDSNSDKVPENTSDYHNRNDATTTRSKKSATQNSIDKQFSLTVIMETMNSFLQGSDTFREIGGVHSAHYISGSTTITVEDIGRHNCIDKICGILLTKHLINHTANGILYLSGRISSEIMTKLIRLSIPIVVARSTPTAAAVRMARRSNITIIGYMKKMSGFIYSCPNRITIKSSSKHPPDNQYE